MPRMSPQQWALLQQIYKLEQSRRTAAIDAKIAAIRKQLAELNSSGSSSKKQGSDGKPSSGEVVKDAAKKIVKDKVKDYVKNQASNSSAPVAAGTGGSAVAGQVAGVGTLTAAGAQAINAYTSATGATAVGTSVNGGILMSDGATIGGGMSTVGGGTATVAADGTVLSSSSSSASGAGTGMQTAGKAAAAIPGIIYGIQTGSNSDIKPSRRVIGMGEGVGQAVAGWFTGGLSNYAIEWARRNHWTQDKAEKLRSIDVKWNPVTQNLSKLFHPSTKKWQKWRAYELLRDGVTGYEGLYINSKNEEADPNYGKDGTWGHYGGRKDSRFADNFQGWDENGRWIDNLSTGNKDVSTMSWPSVVHSQGNFATFKNDWMGKYSEPQRNAITTALIRGGFYKGDKGDIIIPGEKQEEAKRIAEQVAASMPADLNSLTPEQEYEIFGLAGRTTPESYGSYKYAPAPGSEPPAQPTPQPNEGETQQMDFKQDPRSVAGYNSMAKADKDKLWEQHKLAMAGKPTTGWTPMGQSPGPNVAGVISQISNDANRLPLPNRTYPGTMEQPIARGGNADWLRQFSNDFSYPGTSDPRQAPGYSNMPKADKDRLWERHKNAMRLKDSFGTLNPKAPTSPYEIDPGYSISPEKADEMLRRIRQGADIDPGYTINQDTANRMQQWREGGEMRNTPIMGGSADWLNQYNYGGKPSITVDKVGTFPQPNSTNTLIDPRSDPRQRAGYGTMTKQQKDDLWAQHRIAMGAR